MSLSHLLSRYLFDRFCFSRKRKTSVPSHDRLQSFLSVLEDRTMLSAGPLPELDYSVQESAADSEAIETNSDPNPGDLAITKTSNQVAVEQGAQTTYTVTVTNQGPGRVDDAVLNDSFSAFLENVSWTAVGSGDVVATLSGTGDILEEIELGSGASITYTIVGTVKKQVREIVTNVATISSESILDTDLTNNSASDSDLVVLSVTGGGAFFGESTFDLNHNSYSNGVDLGDLDGDGDLDAFVANYRANEVWINNGSGQYINSGQMLGLSLSLAVALGDLDGDGDLDAYVANSDGDKVWLNDGNGYFTVLEDSVDQDSAEKSLAVKMGDVDGDGDLDAVVATYFSTETGTGLVVYQNDGAGHFSELAIVLEETSHYAADLALGDLDSDGDLDLVFSKDNNSGLNIENSVYLNDGTGKFIDSGQELSIQPFGSSQVRSPQFGGVNLGDLNGDGHLDVFVTTKTHLSPFSVWINDGQANFTNTGQQFGTPNCIDVALGDLDGDGDLDAYTIRSTDPYLSDPRELPTEIWLNDGTGQFIISPYDLIPSTSKYTSTLSYMDVALGDLDADGDLDAFVIEGLRLSHEVWLNKKPMNVKLTKSSEATTVSPGDQVTYTITVENEDPNLERETVTDLVIQDDYNNVLTNISWSAVASNGAVATLNGTGLINEKIELASNSSITYTVTGTLKLKSPVYAHHLINSTVKISSEQFANIISQGDIVADNDILVLSGTGGNGIFTPTGHTLGEDLRHAYYHTILGDLDGDGDLDAIVDFHSNRCEIWFNDGTGNFVKSDSFPKFENEYTTIKMVDYDRDGDLDLIALQYNSMEIYTNDGKGHFSPIYDQQLDVRMIHNIILPGDTNGDGDLDILLWDRLRGIYNYGFNLGGDNFQFGTPYDYLPAGDNKLVLGDLDGDGDLDALALAKEVDEGVSVDRILFNDGLGIFTHTDSSITHSPEDPKSWENSSDAAFADMDGDGDLDILYSFSLWLNDGNGYFTDSGQVLGEHFMFAPVSIGDIDGDGDPDAFIGNKGWLNDGAGHLTPTNQHIPEEEDFLSFTTFGDLDGDGDLDLVWGNEIFLNGAVNTNGKTIYLAGTTENDNYVVTYNDSHLSIKHNGQVTNYAFSQYDNLILHGLDGQDSLTFNGTQANESFETEGSSLTLHGDKFTFTAGSMENIIINSGGGDDVVEMLSASGSNTLNATPHTATMSGERYSNTANHFKTINAKVVNGYADATVGDSGGDDIFTVKPDYTSMTGTDYAVNLYGFGTVVGNSNIGGFDRAYFYDSDSVDTFTMTVDSATLTRSIISHTANGFNRTYGISRPGENDIAIINDTVGNDTVVMKHNQSYIAKNNIIAYANNFSKVTANSNAGGQDRVNQYDSSGDDTAIMTPTSSTITGDGFQNIAYDFRQVNLYATKGGNDSVTLNDSEGNDKFDAKHNQSYMRGDGYSNYTFGFESIIANSENGGTDIAHLHDSFGADVLTMSATSAVLTSEGLSNAAYGFNRVYGYSRNGGNDTATVEDSEGNDTYVARSKYSYMREAGVYNYIVGYGDITANATNGGTDRATLHDSSAYEELLITPTSTTMSRTGYSNQVNGFERVYSDAKQGGGDIATIKGSTGNDYLIVKPGYSYLHSKGLESYAIGYEVVHAYANGGTNDIARFTDTAGNELFTEMGTYAQYESEGMLVYAHNFDSMELNGSAGGTNTIHDVENLDAAYSTIGTWLYSNGPFTIDTPATAGTSLFDSVNPFSDLTFTDVRTTATQGVFTQTITIELLQSGNNTALSVSVLDDGDGNKTIRVNLATDANGDVTSTASQVANAINTNGLASTLLMASAEGTGSGIISTGTIQLGHGKNAIYL